MRNACRIDVHQVPEDGAVRRKIGCILQNVFERHLIVPFEFDPPGQMVRASRRNSPCQNFSLGEAPLTIAIVFVRGRTRRIFSKRDGKSLSDRHNGIVFRQLVVFDPALLHGREDHRRSRKNAMAIPLDEVRGRCADSEMRSGGFPHRAREDSRRMGRLICRPPAGHSKASGREIPQTLRRLISERMNCA